MAAWPEFYGTAEGEETAFPGTGTDMSGFVLEEATPQSFLADLDAIVAANQRVTLREEAVPLPEFAPRPDRPAVPVLPHPEWT